MELIIILLAIFILTNKNKPIIKDTGFYSFIIISFGCLFKNISNYFVIEDELKNCYKYTLYSSIGFILIYIPFTIKLIISTSFSLKFNNSKKDIILMNNIFSYPLFKSMFLSNKETQTSYNNVYSNTSKLLSSKSTSINTIMKNDEESFKKTETTLHTINKPNMQYTNETKSEIQLYKKSKSDIHLTDENKLNNQQYEINDEGTSLSSMNINGKKLTPQQKFELLIIMTYLEISIAILLFIYIVILNILNIFILWNKNNEKTTLINVQMINSLFAKTCPNNKINIILYISEFILLLYHISKTKKVFEGRYIFKENRIICLIAIFWIFLDPGLNVIMIIIIII